MSNVQINRRGFIKTATAMGLAASAASRIAGAESGRVRLGAPVFRADDDPEHLALAHKSLGYRAAYCPEVALEDTDRIKALSMAFAKHDVVIAEVGRWCNMMDADPDVRKTNINKVIDGLALAESIGALCCVNIAGSFNREHWFGPHPRNLSPEFFALAVENARTILDAVKPKRAKFTYEMMGWSIPDSVDAYLDLMKAIDRDGFAVHLDPCNLINSPERFYRSTDLLHDCFDRLGPHIVSCHAKDLAWEVEMNIHFREVCPGTGSLDYSVYLQRLAKLPQQPPLMLEHLSNAEEYDAARNYLLELGPKAGVKFS